MKNIVCFLFVLSVFSFAEEKQILFAGSSSTYYHDLPGQVAKMLNDKDPKGQKWESTIAGRSGDSIHVYLEPGFNRYQYGVPKGEQFLDVVKTGNYDYLVMMAVCRFIKERFPVKHNEAIDIYSKAIKDAGGEPVIYEMGWEKDSDTQKEGVEIIFNAAVRNKIRIYAPCSRAWAKVRKERPDLELHNLPDTVHPGTLGAYLNLACFYAAFTRSSPVGMNQKIYNWPRMSKEDKKAKLATIENKKVEEPYVKKLPSWMRENYILRDYSDIPQEVKTYLETVAWQTWQEVDKRLEAAGVPLKK